MKYILLLLFCILSLNIYPQNWLKVDSVFSVSGVTVKNFSAPFFTDIDNDADLDLFLGNIDDKADFFRNNSNLFPSTFSIDTSLLWNIYSGGLINTNADYPVLADLDNDNDFDLIIGGYYGLLYYENVGTISSPDFVKNDSIFSNVNSQIGGDPKPALTDLDDDGDLDLLVGIGESFVAGPEPGLTLGFRNNGTPQNPEFILDNTLVNGIPDVGLNSYPAFADLDNDEDYDLLIGRDGGALFYYGNTGTKLNLAWTREFSTFASVEASTYWKNPCFADLDSDGDFDLAYGTSSGTIYVYRNNGTSSNSDFQYYPDYFKIIRLDGNSSTVSLADFDGDGDNDLLSGIWTGKFIYFRNDGDDLAPMFTQTTMPFSNLSVGSYSSPVFIDLDNDQDYDIVSGALNGQIFCYINTNGSFVENSTIFNFIDVGYTSIPAFADIDANDDLDLLVGSETGSDYRFYLNEGNNVFQENTTIFSGIAFPNYSRPALADIDNDEDYDLIIGRISGDITFYRNDGDKFSPIWINTDTLFTSVEADQSAHPGFTDMDGDSRKDLILGEYNGNFTFYKNLFSPVSVDDPTNIVVERFHLFQNFPNPFNPNTNIGFRISDFGFVSLKVYDVLGNEVATLVNEEKPAGYYEIEFNASLLSSGIYFYKLQAGEYTETKKMILLK